MTPPNHHRIKFRDVSHKAGALSRRVNGRFEVTIDLNEFKISDAMQWDAGNFFTSPGVKNFWIVHHRGGWRGRYRSFDKAVERCQKLALATPVEMCVEFCERE